MHARLRGSKSLLTPYQIINKPDFPSLVDEITEPRPDMNIKVAAFTVSEKSINTCSYKFFKKDYLSLLYLNIHSSGQTLRRVQISQGHDPRYEMAHHLEQST